MVQSIFQLLITRIFLVHSIIHLHFYHFSVACDQYVGIDDSSADEDDQENDFFFYEDRTLDHVDVSELQVEEVREKYYMLYK